MKVGIIMANLDPPTSAEVIDQAVDMILCAEDVSDPERGAFVCGYLAGLGVAIVRRDDPLDLVAEMSTRMMEWQLRGWI